MAQAPRIVDGLRRRLPADWPAAVVQFATDAQQRCGLTTLGELPAMLLRAGFGSPAVLLIGRVLEGSTLAQAGQWLASPAAQAAG